MHSTSIELGSNGPLVHLTSDAHGVHMNPENKKLSIGLVLGLVVGMVLYRILFG
ncbi:MAG: hypothetical protein K2Y26_18035 [Gemmatimonadaceae bacterium]|nr:hypothetical protein [Gemmatimonadaceae bacterium]